MRCHRVMGDADCHDHLFDTRKIGNYSKDYAWNIFVPVEGCVVCCLLEGLGAHLSIKYSSSSSRSQDISLGSPILG